MLIYSGKYLQSLLGYNKYFTNSYLFTVADFYDGCCLFCFIPSTGDINSLVVYNFTIDFVQCWIAVVGNQTMWNSLYVIYLYFIYLWMLINYLVNCGFITITAIIRWSSKRPMTNNVLKLGYRSTTI